MSLAGVLACGASQSAAQLCCLRAARAALALQKLSFTRNLEFDENRFCSQTKSSSKQETLPGTALHRRAKQSAGEVLEGEVEVGEEREEGRARRRSAVPSLR
eukprot:54033-Rhodomonas_salina.1